MTNLVGTSVSSKAIETNFPIGVISQLAEHESWRKELYRPNYYLHKWWARRLGSVFRAIIIASCVEASQDVSRLMTQAVRFPDITVFDPFMGSGVTVGESLKLGCKTIGRDINPVSFAMVKAAVQTYSRAEVIATFEKISEAASSKIKSLYTSLSSEGEKLETLYYFWVKVVPCPVCHEQVELFKTRIFAQHAIPNKHSEAKAICPGCRAINNVEFNSTYNSCSICNYQYNPQQGTCNRSKVTCSHCEAKFSLLEVVGATKRPLTHKMYAKMVLLANGHKVFQNTNQHDEELYLHAEKLLPEYRQYIPREQIEIGYNTNQILNYNYRHWSELFNSRQLVSLALLTAEIVKIEKPEIRELFGCLFSGMLEFNNMFASFKGLGTGAVRHMFSNHILKPELMPLEANVWGTDKSSGSFLSLFQTRVLRALEYKDEPFEFFLIKKHGKLHSQKITGISEPLNKSLATDYQTFLNSDSVYLSLGDSANTAIAAEAVDLVITDPPFFDNVHYSELADFFHVWLKQFTNNPQPTTRSNAEVQSAEVNRFTQQLSGVFRECRRVLKTSGLLVFTYHHSRMEGWTALYRAVRAAGFSISGVQPIKSEMAVSVAIQKAKSPINFDLIICCRKAETMYSQPDLEVLSLVSCLEETLKMVQTFRAIPLNLSYADVGVILMGRILAKIGNVGDLDQELQTLQEWAEELPQLAINIVKQADKMKFNQVQEEQLVLLF